MHTGHAPVALALGELNDDGRPDVVVVNDDSSLTTLLGDGVGGLGGQRDIPVGSDVVAVALGDLDSDRLLDAVVSSPTAGIVFSMIGSGDGNLVVAHELHGPWSPGPLALVPVDAFERLPPPLVGGERSLFVADLFFQTLVVARHLDGGVFSFERQVAGFVDPVSIAVGDLTPDALPDVAVADAASHVATVLTDVEESAFAERRERPLAGRPVAVAVGDLDGDRFADPVFVTRSPSELVTCRTLADGSLGPARAEPVGPAPVALALGDFDADGRLDAAVVDSFEVSISVWLGRGDGTFTRLGSIPTGAGPVALAVADMNRDGWPDLVCANHRDGTVQVLLNTSTLAAGSIQLLAPTPNPASTTSRITFVLSTSASVRLELYDLSGRLVRRLVDDVVMPPGAHTVVWDGNTTHADRARSGIYFAHLRAGSAEATTRLVLGR